jgi:aldehyde:ferredoxin oxidoreductase
LVDCKKKKVVSLEVTSEVHDSKVMKKLVDRVSENNDVRRVLADGAYMIARRISSIYMIIELNLPSRCERILLVNQMVVIAIRGN